jgi:hypothetical protein
MTFSISDISGAVPPQLAGAPALTPPATQPQPQPAADTVVLSQSAQVSQLYLQGQSTAQIAETLGMPLSDVDSDLGIIIAPAAPTPAAAPTNSASLAA